MVVEDLTANTDLVLLDVIMPEMDGYVACSLLKSEQLTQNFRLYLFLLMSLTINKKSMDSGSVDYLAKPVNAKKIISINHLNYINKNS